MRYSAINKLLEFFCYQQALTKMKEEAFEKFLGRLGSVRKHLKSF